MGAGDTAGTHAGRNPTLAGTIMKWIFNKAEGGGCLVAQGWWLPEEGHLT